MTLANVSLPAALYTSAEVRELDRIAIEARGIAGIRLMRRAAEACVRALQSRYPKAQSIAVYCGSGNNAGDGYIVAGLLAEAGMKVAVHVVGDPLKLGPDARRAHQYWETTEAARVSSGNEAPEVIVDALLGTGLSGVVRPEYEAAIQQINASGLPVLAVDVPSGLCADTGRILGAAVRADCTVTFIGLKRGLFTLDGPDCAGEIVFDDLSVPMDVHDEVPTSLDRLSYARLADSLTPRRKNAHKNQFGHVLVVGGDNGMGGAVAMACEAALMSGAGLVSCATHAEHVNALLARRPELMVRGVDSAAGVVAMVERASVVVLGPGLGQSAWSETFWHATVEAVLRLGKTMVVDADGLTWLASAQQSYDKWVLTPHPGEAGRLLPDEDVQADRFGSARALTDRYGGAVVLKGVGSIVDDGNRQSVCPYGNPGMATAGMGDVLSGIIGALLAQELSPGNAARLGTTVHALAGDDCAAASGQRGLLATELLPRVRARLNPGLT